MVMMAGWDAFASVYAPTWVTGISGVTENDKKIPTRKK